MEKPAKPEFVHPVWITVKDCLERKKHRIFEEIRSYPPPITGCDVQFNRLLEERDAISRELRRLDSVYRGNPPQVEPALEAFIASSTCIEGDAKEALRRALKANLLTNSKKIPSSA